MANHPHISTQEEDGFRIFRWLAAILARQQIPLSKLCDSVLHHETPVGDDQVKLLLLCRELSSSWSL
jgi:hypothetical protein